MNWTLEGYAGRWNKPLVARNGCRLTYKPKCFVWNIEDIELQFMHDPGRSFGTARSLGMTLWQDSAGLAFSIRPRKLDFGYSNLVLNIASGSYCECSILSMPEKTDTELRGDRLHTDFMSARVLEITVCPRGACAGTGIWVASHRKQGLLPANLLEPAAQFEANHHMAPV